MTRQDQTLTDLRQVGRSMVAHMQFVLDSIPLAKPEERLAMRALMLEAVKTWQRVCQSYADTTDLRYPPRRPGS